MPPATQHTPIVLGHWLGALPEIDFFSFAATS